MDADYSADISELIAVTGETRERVQVIQDESTGHTNLFGQVIEAVQGLIELTGEVHAEVTKEVGDNSFGELLGRLEAMTKRNGRMLARLITAAGLPPEA